jgi:hypothetical protein
MLYAIPSLASDQSFLMQLGDQTLVARAGETLNITTGDSVTYVKDQDCVGCRLIVIQSDVGQTSFVDYDKPLKLRDAQSGDYKLEVCREKPLENPPCMYLSVSKPRIDYVLATINDTLQVLRPEDTVTLSKTAQFKVQRVMTNVYDRQKVSVRMTGVENTMQKLIQGEYGKKTHLATKFEFLLDDKAFTEIPVEVTAE